MKGADLKVEINNVVLYNGPCSFHPAGVQHIGQKW